MDSEYHTKVAICLSLLTLVVGVILFWCVIAGMDATRRDRTWRIERAKACATIEDQAMRTLCLVKAP